MLLLFVLALIASAHRCCYTGGFGVSSYRLRMKTQGVEAEAEWNSVENNLRFPQSSLVLFFTVDMSLCTGQLFSTGSFAY